MASFKSGSRELQSIQKLERKQNEMQETLNNLGKSMSNLERTMEKLLERMLNSTPILNEHKSVKAETADIDKLLEETA